MNDMDDFVGKTIDFLKAHICPLTNLKECIGAVERYASHEDEIRLVDEVFDVLTNCEEDHCISNKDEVRRKIIDYLNENAVE